MFIQGDLQAVFDALYSSGVVDPILKMDWSVVSKQMEKNPIKVQKVIEQINSCSGDRDKILQQMSALDKQAIHFIALEVAREFAEFSDRQTLH